MAERRRAEVAATIGKWLLWMDLLIALFVYTSIRDGSYFFAYWFVAEGVLGLALIAFGSGNSGSCFSAAIGENNTIRG